MNSLVNSPSRTVPSLSPRKISEKEAKSYIVLANKLEDQDYYNKIKKDLDFNG